MSIALQYIYIYIYIYQDIVNAITLVEESKQQLHDEWESLLTEVSSFCTKHEIPIPNIDERFMRVVFYY